jgi:pantothenate kinase
MAKKIGRPKGSTVRPQLRDFLTQAQVTRLTNKAYDMAEEGDSTILKFMLEQIYGKAVQPLGNDDGKALLVKFDNVFNEPASPSKRNSP